MIGGSRSLTYKLSGTGIIDFNSGRPGMLLMLLDKKCNFCPIAGISGCIDFITDIEPMGFCPGVIFGIPVGDPINPLRANSNQLFTGRRHGEIVRPFLPRQIETVQHQFGRSVVRMGGVQNQGTQINGHHINHVGHANDDSQNDR